MRIIPYVCKTQEHSKTIEIPFSEWDGSTSFASSPEDAEAGEWRDFHSWEFNATAALRRVRIYNGDDLALTAWLFPMAISKQIGENRQQIEYMLADYEHGLHDALPGPAEFIEPGFEPVPATD